MNKFSFLKYSFTLLLLVLFSSCDKDVTELGSNIIGDGDFELSRYLDASVKTYNQFDQAVQSNNLPINQLGIIDNGDFGTTTSSFVSQVQLSKAYTIPEGAIIDDIELVVPYFSTLKTGTTDAYKLDSIYGSGKIKLSIHENGKYLRNLNELLEPQRYYSDEFALFESVKKPILLNDNSAASQNTEFQFSALQQEDFEVINDTVSRTKTAGIFAEKLIKVSPRMKIKLNKTYFQNGLFANKSVLLNNGIFLEYFRGLFFKVENVGIEKALASMNFAAGKITIYYKTAAADVQRKAVVLNLTGNTVNLFQNTTTTSLPTNTTPVAAGDKLYLKGGAGYHSYLDMFGTADDKGLVTDRTEIDILKEKNWLINEANLVFTIDELSNTNQIPSRIYIYDAYNKLPIIDFALDETASTTKPKTSKVIYGGVYSENKNAGGNIISKTYKFRITNHIKNIINNDAKNVRLGISVTEDIGIATNRYLKNIPDTNYFSQVPLASIINPLGVVLWGSNVSIPLEKRVKLEIFYTKPN